MSAEKHSPGPWEVYDVSGRSAQSVVARNDTIVAEVHGKLDEECKANGRLIAAAPELLQALANVVTSIDQRWQIDVQGLRALLSRINGGDAPGTLCVYCRQPLPIHPTATCDGHRP